MSLMLFGKKKNIASLKELTERLIVSEIFSAFQLRNETTVLALQTLPSNLVDDVMKTLFQECESTTHSYYYSNPSDFLRFALSVFSKMTTLDPSDLYRIRIPNFHRIKIARTLLTDVGNRSTIYLTKIILKGRLANRKDTTPVCNDSILQAIGKTCLRLTVLDVSFNLDVSSQGLECLLPNGKSGCKNLKELYVYGCPKITAEPILLLLRSIPSITQIGFKALGDVLAEFYFRNKKRGEKKYSVFFNLLYIDNLGVSKNDLYRVLRCDCKKTKLLNELCPFLESLRARVLDKDVEAFAILPNLRSLELVYHCSETSSPGHKTVNFLKKAGHRLRVLRIRCDEFPSSLFQAIVENCPNLETLWCRFNKVVIDHIPVPIKPKNEHATCPKPLENGFIFPRIHDQPTIAATRANLESRTAAPNANFPQDLPRVPLWRPARSESPDYPEDAFFPLVKTTRGLPALKILYLGIGHSGTLCVQPQFSPEIVKFLIAHSVNLEELIVSANSPDINDQWLKMAVKHLKPRNVIRKVHIESDRKNPTVLPLTAISVNMLLDMCPQLKELGNLTDWDFSVLNIAPFCDDRIELMYTKYGKKH